MAAVLLLLQRNGLIHTEAFLKQLPSLEVSG